MQPWIRGCTTDGGAVTTIDTVPNMADTAVTMTVKVGAFRHSWHALHVTATVMTGGWWFAVYVLHAVLWTLNRASVTLEIPPGGRIEYRDGYPNVLMEDEYLTPRPARERFITYGPWVIPAVVVAGLITMQLASS